MSRVRGSVEESKKVEINHSLVRKRKSTFDDRCKVVGKSEVSVFSKG